MNLSCLHPHRWKQTHQPGRDVWVAVSLGGAEPWSHGPSHDPRVYRHRWPPLEIQETGHDAFWPPVKSKQSAIQENLSVEKVNDIEKMLGISRDDSGWWSLLGCFFSNTAWIRLVSFGARLCWYMLISSCQIVADVVKFLARQGMSILRNFGLRPWTYWSGMFQGYL